MKRDRSNLSRDELGLLLSVCEQRADEKIARLQKRLAVTEKAASKAVRHCAEPLCTAVSVYEASQARLHYFDCHCMFTCEYGVGCNCDYWCDQHAEGQLTMCTKMCAKHAVADIRDRWKILCSKCVPMSMVLMYCGCEWSPYVHEKEGLK